MRIGRRLGAYELARASAAMERGESVRYGRFTLSGEGLTIDDETFGWVEVREVAQHNPVAVWVHSRKRSVVRASSTPHSRTLYGLAQQLSPTMRADRDAPPPVALVDRLVSGIGHARR